MKKITVEFDEPIILDTMDELHIVCELDSCGMEPEEVYIIREDGSKEAVAWNRWRFYFDE